MLNSKSIVNVTLSNIHFHPNVLENWIQEPALVSSFNVTSTSTVKCLSYAVMMKVMIFMVSPSKMFPI